MTTTSASAQDLLGAVQSNLKLPQSKAFLTMKKIIGFYNPYLDALSAVRIHIPSHATCRNKYCEGLHPSVSQQCYTEI